MKLKLVTCICLLAMMPALAQAQIMSRPEPPKLTLADVQKLVQSIAGDKAKLQTYCDLAKNNVQVADAYRKKDTKRVEELTANADALADQLGPDFGKVMDGLVGIEENSPLGRQIVALLDTLDKQCK